MRFFIDTEFIEYPCTIDLISIGLVCQDRREYYAESAEVDWSKANPFVTANVRPHLFLDNDTERKSRAEIAEDIRYFVLGAEAPEFWGYYADYDWVVFCWLFGAMVDLPQGWPMYCRDLKQLADDSGVPHETFPPDPVNAHNALADARWNAELYAYLDGRNHGRG